MESQVILPGTDQAAVLAAGLQDLPVHVHQIARSGALVQVVDVLGDQQQFARPVRLQPGQGQVRRVGRHLARQEAPAPIVVEVVHPCRIAREGLGRGHVFQAHLGPDAVGIAEGIQAGFLRDPGAGQDDDRGVRLRHDGADDRRDVGLAIGCGSWKK
jgi:hypothetical protein